MDLEKDIAFKDIGMFDGLQKGVNVAADVFGFDNGNLERGALCCELL